MNRKAIFLDKDGTLIDDVPYNVNPGLITLSKKSVEGLRLLQNEGYLLVVISNQSGVGYGYFDEQDLTGVKEKLYSLLGAEGVQLNGFYYCPHLPGSNCTCRKPQPGLILQAAVDLYIDLQASWMIGDILNDMEAGNRAGCKSILIDNGNETEWVLNDHRKPAMVCSSINEAADQIISTIAHGQLETL